MGSCCPISVVGGATGISRQESRQSQRLKQLPQPHPSCDARCVSGSVAWNRSWRAVFWRVGRCKELHHAAVQCVASRQDPHLWCSAASLHATASTDAAAASEPCIIRAPAPAPFLPAGGYMGICYQRFIYSYILVVVCAPCCDSFL